MATTTCVTHTRFLRRRPFKVSIAVREQYQSSEARLYQVSPAGLSGVFPARNRDQTVFLPDEGFLKSALKLLDALRDQAVTLVATQSALEAADDWTLTEERRLEKLLRAPDSKWLLLLEGLYSSGERHALGKAIRLLREIFGFRVVVLSEEAETHAWIRESSPGVEACGLESFLRNLGAVDEAQRQRLRELWVVQDAQEKRSTKKATDLKAVQSVAELPLPPRMGIEEVMHLVEAGTFGSGALEVFPYNAHAGFVKASLRSQSGQRLGARLHGEFGIDIEEQQSHVQLYVPNEKAMHGCLHGDKVAFEVLPRRLWVEDPSAKRLVAPGMVEDARPSTATSAAPCVRVISLIQRQRTKIVASLLASGAANDSGRGAQLATPYDPKLPRVRLRSSHKSNFVGKRLLLGLEDWEHGNASSYPDAYYIATLGPIGSTRTEVLSLLLDAEMQLEPFSNRALAELPPAPTPPKEPQVQVLRPPSGTSMRDRDGATAFGFGSGLADGSEAAAWQDSGWDVDHAEAARRRDLRSSHVVFSIDPPGCQDIDDAMSVRFLANGHVEVGVHIADVTHFVAEHSSLDVAARKRGETLYLPNTRFDMLPKLLGSDVCSLQGGKNRYAVSVFWEVSGLGEALGWASKARGETAIRLEDCRIGETTLDEKFVPAGVEIENERVWFGRTVINNAAAMTYAQANALLRESFAKKQDKARYASILGPQPPPPPGEAGAPVKAEIWRELRVYVYVLTLVARCLKRRREQGGALELSNGGRELDFELRGTNLDPEKYRTSDHLETHDTVMELMILANSSVAEKVLKSSEAAGVSYNPCAVLRSHNPTATKKVEDILRVLQDAGVGSVAKIKEDALAQNEAHPGRRVAAVMMQLAIEQVRKTQHLPQEVRRSLLSLLKSNMVEIVSEAQYRVAGRLDGSEEALQRLGHFGLGLQYYTHFTSPIRRYPDVIVHRQLLRALEGQAERVSSPSAHSRHKTYIPVAELESILRDDDPGVYKKLPPPGADNGATTVDDELDALLSNVETGPEPPLRTAAPAQTKASVGADDDLAIGDDLDIDDLLGDVNVPVPTDGMSALTIAHGGSAAEAAKEAAAKAAKAAAAKAAKAEAGSDMINVDDLLGDIGSRSSSSSGDLVNALGLDELIVKIDNANTATHGFKEDPALRRQELELSALCDHLNEQHRKCRIVSLQCSRLFLSLYLYRNPTVYEAVVDRIFENGFRAYVPDLDLKSPVYLADKEGLVHLPEDLAGGLAKDQPQAGFAGSGRHSAYPGLQLRVEGERLLVVAKEGRTDSNALVRLERMDMVKVLLTCDVSADRARVPEPRAHFLGMQSDRPIAVLRSRKLKGAPLTRHDERRSEEQSEQSRSGMRWKDTLSKREVVREDAAANSLYRVLEGFCKLLVQRLAGEPQDDAEVLRPHSYVVSVESDAIRLPRVRARKSSVKARDVDRVERGKGRFVFGGFQPPAEGDQWYDDEDAGATTAGLDSSAYGGAQALPGAPLRASAEVRRFTRENDRLAAEAMRRQSKLKARKRHY